MKCWTVTMVSTIHPNTNEYDTQFCSFHSFKFNTSAHDDMQLKQEVDRRVAEELKTITDGRNYVLWSYDTNQD